MYYSGTHDQRAYTGNSSYPYADFSNEGRPATYNNYGYNYNDFYQSYSDLTHLSYREQQRSVYEQRVPQLDNNSSQPEKSSYMSSSSSVYARAYTGYNNVDSQFPQVCSNEYTYKSPSSELTTRTDISEHGDKYFPPCALQYYETDVDSNEDDEFFEQRNSCAYAKTLSRDDKRCDNERGMNRDFSLYFSTLL